MNKKAIIRTAIAIVFTGAAITIYIATRPKPLTDCEILLMKGLDAKSQAEKDYADKQWRDLCVTTQP